MYLYNDRATPSQYGHSERATEDGGREAARAAATVAQGRAGKHTHERQPQQLWSFTGLSGQRGKSSSSVYFTYIRTQDNLPFGLYILLIF